MAEYNSAHTGPEIDAAVSAVKTKQSTWDNKVDGAALTASVEAALTQAKNSGEFDGPQGPQGNPGKDGVSATHSWSGTTLTVTSASGTSSANLKGDKGDTGAAGKDGHTPVKGTDYWTAADKAEMLQYIEENATSGGASSWNDLKDKPVIMTGTPDTLTWDGNTEGLVCVDISGDGTLPYYHVSYATPTLEDFSSGGTVVEQLTGDTCEISTASMSSVIMVTYAIGETSGFVGALVIPSDNFEYNGLLFSKKGVYLSWNETYGRIQQLTIPGYTGFATEKLDPDYLYQPNWNQSDESAPDYVKNRTHHDAWSANKFAQEIAFTTNDGATFGNFNQSLGLEAGKTYTILCDGDEYTGVAEAVDLFGTTAVRVGDFDAIGGTSETMSTPICVYDMGDGGVVFLKETFTEETSKFVVVLEGKNKEEYWIVALDPAESPLYSNMFVASWKPVPYSDFAHGFSAVLSIDGVEYSVNDADPKVWVTSTPDGYWTLHYDSILVALCSESAIVFINDTQAGLNNTPQVDMKKLTFNEPVFAPSMELKKLDSKYLPTPSWNDLKDKPFGDKVTLDSGELTFKKHSALEVYCAFISREIFSVAGDRITVTFDGTEYECIVKADPSGGTDLFAGNGSIHYGFTVAEDTGEPFCLVRNRAFETDIITHSTESSHVVSVTTAQKIAEKYLPPHTHSWNDLSDKPFGDTLAEIMPETEVVGVEDGESYVVELDASLFSGDEDFMVVTFDGSEYTCGVSYFNDFPCYGNAVFLGGDDTGEPFCLVVMKTHGIAMMAVVDAEPHTVKISALVAKKLATKYVDNQTIFFPGDDGYLYLEQNHTTKVTLNDLRRAATNGSIALHIYINNNVWQSTAYPNVVVNLGTYGVVYASKLTGAMNAFYTAEYTGA